MNRDFRQLYMYNNPGCLLEFRRNVPEIPGIVPEFRGIVPEIPGIVLEASRMNYPGRVHIVLMLLFILRAKAWSVSKLGLFMFRCSTLTAHFALTVLQNVKL